MKQHLLQATEYMLWQLQEFLKARGIVINGTTVIQQAAVTQLSDNNSECLQGPSTLHGTVPATVWVKTVGSALCMA